jgi:integrase
VSTQYLTDAFVSSVLCPADKQQEIVWDGPIGADGKVRNGAVGGLGLRVTRTGQKAFVHGYRFNGRRVRRVIGTPPVLNVAAARLKVHQRERAIAGGTDPDVVDIDYRKAHSITVRELIDRCWDQHLSKTSKSNRQSFRALVASWVMERSPNARGGPKRGKITPFADKRAHMAAVTVTPQTISDYVNGISSDYQANAALRHLKALYNWAIRMQLVDMRNPCDPIPLRKVVRRRRDYTLEEIKTIAGYIFQPPLDVLPSTAELNGMDKQKAALAKGRVVTANAQMVEFCGFMGLLLLTMARPNEVLRAEFAHFDSERLVWHKHDTKGLKLSRAVSEYAYRSVPIHPKVADLVAAQRQRWPDSQLLFPSHADLTKPRDNFRRCLTRFKALPGVPAHFQLYDLKRIAISLMLTAHGVNRSAVSHLADHRGNLDTTLIYDLQLVEPLRPVTSKLGELLEL